MHEISRRGWLLGAFGARWAYGFGAKDFWDAKDPAEWSSDEIRKLTTKSPWAHEITGERTAAKKKASEFPRTDPMGRRPRVTAPNTRVVASYKGTLVWESAKPVREAFRSPTDEEFAGMYVLSLAGLPVGAGKGALEKVRAATTLQVKGHDPLGAALVKHSEGNSLAMLFGFARAGAEITKEDKEVIFLTTVNRVRLSGKFNPREMLYRGELAL